MGCDGQFSEEEYQSAERQKQALRSKVRSAQSQLSIRAQELATRMAQMRREAQEFVAESTKVEKLLLAYEQQIADLTRTQSDMVVRQSWVLDALDREEGYEPDEPEPTSPDVPPSASQFAFDDGQLATLLAMETNQDGFFELPTTQSETGSSRVPMSFLIRRTLTI